MLTTLALMTKGTSVLMQNNKVFSELAWLVWWELRHELEQMMLVLVLVFHQAGKSKEILGISSYASLLEYTKASCLSTYLTSRGVPALFKILTTDCTPFTFSNDRNELGASTSIHNSVSSTIDDKCGW
jgi:hypothetical protein